MRDFHSLKVWRKSHNLALEVYRTTAGFPQDEVYGLRNQLRRSATSIPSNLAVGCGRGGDRDFLRFIQIALGSASETEYHLLLARDLGYLSGPRYDHLVGDIGEVKRMLTGLRAANIRSPLKADG